MHRELSWEWWRSPKGHITPSDRQRRLMYALHEADCQLDTELRGFHNRYGRPFQRGGEKFVDQHHSMRQRGRVKELGWTPIWQSIESLGREVVEALGFTDFLARPAQPEPEEAQFLLQYAA